MAQEDKSNSTSNETAGPADPVHVRVSIDVCFDANGERAEHLRARLEQALARAIGGGLLSGETTAEVDSYTTRVTTLTPEAVALDHVVVSRWLMQRRKDSELDSGDLAELASRYALTSDRGSLLNELAERIDDFKLERATGLDREDIGRTLDDAMGRANEYGFAITRDNVVEVVREELALSRYLAPKKAEDNAMLDAAILAVFEAWTPDDDGPERQRA